MKIVIIGAGIAGLVAALRLSESNDARISEIRVIDRSSRPGGLIKTELDNGDRWDHGSYLFLENTYLVDTLPGIFDQVHDLSIKIWLDGEYHNFPFELKKLFGGMMLPLYLKLLFFYGRALPRLLMENDNASLETWLRNRLAPVIIKKTNLDQYLVKLQGIPADEISKYLGQARLKDIEPANILKSLIKRIIPRKNKDIVTSYKNFYPLTKGVGIVPLTLFEMCKKRGVKFTFDADLKRVKYKKVNGVELEYETSDGTVNYNASFLISSICLNDLVKACRTEVTTETINMAEDLEFTDSHVSMFTISRPKIHHDYYVLYSFSREHKWKKLTAISLNNGTTSVIVETTYNPARFKPEDSMLDSVQKALVLELGLFKEKEVISRKYRIVKNTYPILRVGYQSIVDRIIMEIESEKVKLIGRQGRFAYWNTHDVARSAIKASEDILHSIDETDAPVDH